ncbi:MBL fold metallo-hydrolase [Amycolatopsis sp. Hca4]|uniref:MBL fold metallo-hydrolase n=1 Tax=Amycolatopsis sp. Hca4 TaxID=2742131 RepID=UPI0015922467|nr:MBL fold metallo-hydrolase [Amycolatopsis sp. Hca4]QKV80539.1 MBL fold metallo-hydrolase [Amycolatopsis sp. Hca4]
MSDGSRAAALSAARRASARYRTSPWPGRLHVTAHHPAHADPLLTFLGGARYLLAADTTLLVGCGLFEGPETAWRHNFSPGPDELHAADAVILPSADLGHAGFLPQLVAEGWHGPVFATPATAALLPVVLSDAAKQFAEDAAQVCPPPPGVPPFRAEDVTRALALVRPVEFGSLHRFGGVEIEFGRAGGLLGAAWVRVRAGGRSVVFAGPLGTADHPLLRAPDPCPRSDVLVFAAPRPAAGGHLPGRFAAAIHRAVRRGGCVVVPVSVDGGVEVLRALTETGQLPPVPVVLDGDLGLDVHRKAAGELRRGARVPAPRLRAEPPDGPSVILAGLGTADSGRVLRHLARVLPDRRGGVVLCGHPAPGTRAAQLANGARHLKIHGRYVPVRAEVTALGGTGAFAGPEEVLAWATATPAPETAFVAEGDAEAAQALAKALHAQADWCAVVPEEGERVLC